VSEATPAVPVSPYGASKLMSEWMLRDSAQAYGLKYVALRYFNVAGADPKGRSGQSTPRATHLIKVACEAATGKRKGMQVFGTDYPTNDGTCIRDYIHVSDLVGAHMDALRYLKNGGGNAVMNCGYGAGYSVLEVIETVKRVSGVDFPVEMAPARAGAIPPRSSRAQARSGRRWAGSRNSTISKPSCATRSPGSGSSRQSPQQLNQNLRLACRARASPWHKPRASGELP
jgi:UDP-glucose 4-epimerase